MKNIEIPETQVATFECEVSHFNVPSTWLKNGVEIEMSEKFRIVVQGKLHQLKIMNTSRDDNAEYTFICGNDRISATLTVSRKLPYTIPFYYIKLNLILIGIGMVWYSGVVLSLVSLARNTVCVEFLSRLLDLERVNCHIS